MRYFTLDAVEIPRPAYVQSVADDDPYTTRPSFVRIYDEGDEEHPWMVDAVDKYTGHYTEDVRTFATEAEAVAFVPEFVAFNREHGGWTV